MISAELLAAYRATCYVVETSPLGAFTLRIDAPSAAADQLCGLHKRPYWAYLTACNPRSQPLSARKNTARMKQLITALDALRLPYYHGAGRGKDPAWPPEQSVFVPGVDRQLAESLARRFNQNAVVYGAVGGYAQLLLIEY